MSHQFSFGVIEGFYKNFWGHNIRKRYISFCKEKGFHFYIYAPKSDQFLREKWQQNWDTSSYELLLELSSSCKNISLDFGVGFTPYGVNSLDSNVRAELSKKISFLNTLKAPILGIFFDDFSITNTHAAQRQVDICHYIIEKSTASQFFFVGTYYSFDPILEKIYGEKPPLYNEDIGKFLDKNIHIFWTGERIISKSYSQEHLQEIAKIYQRKPFIWDNFLANDTPQIKSRFPLLFLPDYPQQLIGNVSGHAINPMIQPHWSLIPLALISDMYYTNTLSLQNCLQNTLNRYFIDDETALNQIIQILLTARNKKNESSYLKNSLYTFFSSYKKDNVYSMEYFEWYNRSMNP